MNPDRYDSRVWDLDCWAVSAWEKLRNLSAPSFLHVLGQSRFWCSNKLIVKSQDLIQQRRSVSPFHLAAMPSEIHGRPGHCGKASENWRIMDDHRGSYKGQVWPLYHIQPHRTGQTRYHAAEPRFTARNTGEYSLPRSPGRENCEHSTLCFIISFLIAFLLHNPPPMHTNSYTHFSLLCSSSQNLVLGKLPINLPEVLIDNTLRSFLS